MTSITAGLSTLRNCISLLIVVIAIAIVVFAWAYSPAAFDDGGWKGAVPIFVGTFYTFFRVRNQNTRLGPVTLTSDTPHGLMLLSDIAAIATFLVGTYSVFGAISNAA
jgi:hypothetical protein